jgi:hypothetical protein
MWPPDLSVYPLCKYFLSGYFDKGKDPTNFPPDQFPALFERYEEVFECALQVLGLTKEELKGRSEFNFDSGDAANLESGTAMLRVIRFLELNNFLNIALVKPKKKSPVADLVCEKNGQRVCWEVKAITKQSRGRSALFIKEQLYDKILENISKAITQLEATVTELHCAVRIFAICARSALVRTTTQRATASTQTFNLGHF